MHIVTIEELKLRLDQDEPFHLLDVREVWEYEEYNIGAKNIPLSSLLSAIPDLEEWKDDEIIIHCKSGIRSMQAVAILQQLGFSNVKNLAGGLDEWKSKFSK